MPLSPATRQRLTIGLGVGTVLLGGWLWHRSGERPSVPASAPASAEPRADVGRQQDLGAPTERPPPQRCDGLAERALQHDHDAVLLAWLCPDRPLDSLTARAVLLAVRSPDEAAALAPRLHEHPAMQGLARLVARERVPAQPGALPDPAQAVVSPVDERVLARVQQAHRLITEPGIALADRTRARAYLAKVYLQATQQLGVSVGRPPGPFGRLLTGRALHYGRQFCLSYWRNRVSGLAGLFADIETRLLELTLAVEAGAPHGDTARLTDELTRARGYLRGDGPRGRIERRLADRRAAPSDERELLPLPNEIERLLVHGLVDLAIAQALTDGRRADGPGLGAMEQWLRDELARREQPEYLALLGLRFERARARTPPPPEDGPGDIAQAAPRTWTPASAVADEAEEFIEHAPAEGLARAHALGRALLLVRDRPDALVLLLDHASDDSATEAMRGSLGWLLGQMRLGREPSRASPRPAICTTPRPGDGVDSR